VLAGNYVGEMALFYDGLRTATVRAAIKSEVVRLPGAVFERILGNNPDLYRAVERLVASRRKLNDYVEAKRESFSSVVDMHTSIARFLLEKKGCPKRPTRWLLMKLCALAATIAKRRAQTFTKEFRGSIAKPEIHTHTFTCQHPADTASIRTA
jgi:CRP-like cAMP-binding protein